MSKHTYKDLRTTRPIDVESMDAFAIKVVAVAGYNGDWAAYCGPTDWTDDKVAEQGIKLFHTQAENLFYVMLLRTYRD